MALHHYDVHIVEPIADMKPIGPGEPTPTVRDVYWSCEAESPEAATGIARGAWVEKYGESPPADVGIRVIPGPQVCPTCEGRGRLPRYLPPGLTDPGDGAPLGSAKKRTCPDCLGSGVQH